MNNSVKTILLFFAVLAVPSCAMLESSYQLEKVYSEQPRVYIRDLLATENDSRVVVSGRLKNRYLFKSVSKGHIDLAVYNSEGTLLSEMTAPYKFSLNNSSIQRRGGSRFSATLEVVPPPGSTIKVAFHQMGSATGSDSEHEYSIAR